MKLFGQLVRTVVNIATLPIAVVKDVVTLGGVVVGRESYTTEQLQKLKDESREDD